MPIRYDDPRPPYVQLASELRNAIAEGEYQPGDRLPSTRQLAETYGIAPATVQHALRVLREEGAVVSHQGRGVYVQEPPAAGADQEVQVPRTLDEALDMLADLNRRIDRLEAQVQATDPGLAPEPPAPGIEP